MATKDKLGITPVQTTAYSKSTKGLSIRGEKVAPTSPPNPDEEFMQLARERFKVCVDAESARREQMLIDLQFRCGDDSNQYQWDSQVLRARTKKRRPSHTVNRIPEFTKHVVNNMRQSRPAIKINPVGDGADQEQAELRQGLIRNIEVKSQAPSAYDTSFEHMCIMGLGWMRVVDDWADVDSIDKDLFIRWVPNPFAVYSDPSACLPDWSDMKYAFVVNDLMPAEFRARYPEEKAVSATNFKSIGDQASNWSPGGKIRVAEYFRIEEEPDILCLLEKEQDPEGGDQVTRWLSDLPKGMYKRNADDRLIMVDPETEEESDVGVALKRDRPVVYWSLITGLDKLQERKWKGPNIPLIPVIGNQFDMDGERLISGMVRFARELQRLYNYVFSTLTEVVALAPKNQFIGEIGQIDEFRDMWERANIDPQAILPYKMRVDETGRAVAPPQRQSAVIEIGGLVNALQIIDGMIKSIFGIYDASLGQRGPQESGLAINARKIESDTSTYDWGDNFIRALEYLGRIINGLLPAYYNRPGRIVRILREDQNSDTVIINKTFIDKKTKKEKKFDLDSGKYSVEVSTGPSYQTKRKESADSMINFFKLYPAGLQACAHILAKEMDFPGKDAIASQLEKLLPPNLQEPKDGEEGPDPNMLQQQVAQLTQLTQALTAELQKATDKTELERMKQMFQTLRDDQKAEMGVIVQLLKNGSAEGMLMAEKNFEEAQRLQAVMEPVIEKPLSEGAPPQSAPAPAGPQGPPQPALAGPPTGGG